MVYSDLTCYGGGGIGALLVLHFHFLVGVAVVHFTSMPVAIHVVCWTEFFHSIVSCHQACHFAVQIVAFPLLIGCFGTSCIFSCGFAFCWNPCSFLVLVLLLHHHCQSLFQWNLIRGLPEALVGKIGELALHFIKESVQNVGR